ncbi:MAG: hypothetical protein CR974_02480 [Gammaproteobacteria bacterium]|nr:MAG: hypothetical protein CR974_02480 [Gammaproteobacteria bacterium]
MNEHDFIALVEASQAKMDADPVAYQRRVSRFILLGGYGFFALLAAVGVAIIVGLLVLLILHPSMFVLLMFKSFIFLPVAGLLWAIVKLFTLKFDAPQGYIINAPSPALKNMLAKMTQTLALPPIHQILIDSNLNAMAVQRPRRSLFGGMQNTLVLGLPLLMLLSPAQIKAVIAHELGHFSGNHGRLSGWIYRTRMTWEGIFEVIMAQDSVFLMPIQYYALWFFPRLSAYAFVVSRANEYEADDISAQLTSKQTTASALVASTVVAETIYGAFWTRVSQFNQKYKDAPKSIWQRLANYADKGYERNRDAIAQNLKKALTVPTTYDDTHPCLADRLAHLGVSPASLTEVEFDAQNSALAYYFAPQQAELFNFYNRQWYEQNREVWQQLYQNTQQARTTIETLSAKAEQGVDDWLKLARAYDELDDAEPALRYYQKVLAHHEQQQNIQQHAWQYAQTAQRIAYLLYQTRDDLAGLQAFATKTRSDLFIAAETYNSVYEALKAAGKVDEALQWQTQAEPLYQRVNQFYEERQSLSIKDTLKPAQLSDEERQTLREAFPSSAKGIFLAEKISLTIRPDIRCLVVVYRAAKSDDDSLAITAKLDERFESIYFMVFSRRDDADMYRYIRNKGAAL